MTDFFRDPFDAMMVQSMWAFQNSILFAGTPEGESFQRIYEYFEKEIEKYLEENGAPWKRS